MLANVMYRYVAFSECTAVVIRRDKPNARMGQAMTEFGVLEITGGRAVVSAGTGLAAEAARDVLISGGNVVDAAITASAVLCVVMPQAVAIGGDLFALVRSGRDGTVTAVGATGAAPLEADIAAFRARGHTHVPLIGPLSIQPPGLVAGWQALHDRWGSRGLDRTLAPAIELARDGCLVSERLARFCAELEADLRPVAGWEDCFAPGGRLLQAGETFRQERLAMTLRRIAEEGAAGFYSGKVAEDLVGTVRDAGGVLSPEDLTRVSAEIADPLRISFRAWRVFTQPPISQGVVLLRALGLIDSCFAPGDHTDPAILWPLAAAALRQAFAERLALLGDGGDRRARALALLRGTISAPRETSAWAHDGQETTTLVVTDRDGNTAALIQSVFADFGSGVIGRDSGVLLNNRLSAFFLDPFHPNALRPGRRTMHTLHNFIAVDHEDRVRFAGGSPGGDHQPQVNLQFLLRVGLLDQTPAEAMAAPRFAIWPGTAQTDATRGQGTVVKCETAMPPEQRAFFSDEGFSVTDSPPIGSLKLVGQSGSALTAWADTRREAAVVAV
jgi:gamma-glutamyltranspeptidase / glutathione hydrolase